MADLISIEKKRQHSNVKRLESVKKWKRDRTLQANQIKISLENLDSKQGVLNKKIKFDSDISEDENQLNSAKDGKEKANAKPLLFAPSDSEGEADANEDADERFRIRSQFQGQRGQQLLEMSSHFTDDRFRLDERFKESEESDVPIEEENNEISEKYDVVHEKKKNFEILEQVLGFQVPKKQSDIEAATAKKRKYLRFDPESQDASMLLKKTEELEDISVEKKEKKRTKKLRSPSPCNDPVVSTDRFFEVKTDLKDIFGKSSSGFSLSKQFGFASDVNSNEHRKKLDTQENPKNDTALQTTESLIDRAVHKKGPALEIQPSSQNNGLKRNFFFFRPGDSRLQEGIDFFQRKQPMEEIREEWMKTRETLMAIFQKGKKLSKKVVIPKVRKGTAPRKRKFNFKRK